jgi:hypothetical protein
MAGDHVPEIPLLETTGKAGMLTPVQYGPTAANVGVTFGVMVMLIVAVVAH